MVAYLRMQYKGNIHQTDNDEYATVKRSFDEADTENMRRYQIYLDKWRQMIALATELYTVNSAEVKYLRRKMPSRPQTHQRTWKQFLHQWDMEMARRKQAEYRQEYRRRVKEAIEILEDVGYERGVHFGGNAITFARENLTEVEPGKYAPMLPAGDE